MLNFCETASPYQVLKCFIVPLYVTVSRLVSYYFQTVAVTGELCRPVYMHVSAYAVDFKGILSLMAKVNWEVKEVMSQHSHYVDILLRVCVIAGFYSLHLSLCWNCETGDV